MATRTMKLKNGATVTVDVHAPPPASFPPRETQWKVSAHQGCYPGKGVHAKEKINVQGIVYKGNTAEEALKKLLRDYPEATLLPET